ncbi:hypothetical protein BgiMline_012915, partial [Biomphalaria glabrata]
MKRRDANGGSEGQRCTGSGRQAKGCQEARLQFPKIELRFRPVLIPRDLIFHWLN